MTNKNTFDEMLSQFRSDMDGMIRVSAAVLGRQSDLPKGNTSGVARASMFQHADLRIELDEKDEDDEG